MGAPWGHTSYSGLLTGRSCVDSISREKNINRAVLQRKNPQDGDVPQRSTANISGSPFGFAGIRTWLVLCSRSTYTSPQIRRVLLIHRNVSALVSPTKITGPWDGLCWKRPHRSHCKSRDTCHQTRMLQTLSSLPLNTSKDDLCFKY